MQLPRRPNSGELITAEFGQQLIDYLRSVAPVSTPTVQVVRSSGGAGYHVLGRGGGGAAEKPKPFELRIVPDPANSTGQQKKLRVYSSLLAGQLPTGFNVSDDKNPFLLTLTDPTYVYAKITINSSYDIASREIIGLNSAQENTATILFILLGSAYRDKDGNWRATNNLFGPIYVSNCANQFTYYTPR